MLSKDITFTNPVTGEEQTRTYLFHLNKAEIIRIVGRDREGDWDAYIKSIVDKGDLNAMLDFIELVVRSAVGYRNANSEFAKTQEFAAEFIASEAYGELFIELLTNKDDAAVKFFSAIVSLPGSKPPANVVNGGKGKHRHRK